jgi:hypothetical protein
VSGWQPLEAEIARWHDLGRSVDLWWRDDDAVDATAALDRLLEIRGAAGAPLALAVVPSRATAALAERLADETAVDVLQHGYSHVNHAPPADKKIELGLHRPAMLVLGELGTGWLALERLFGKKALPVMVPPWNRIAPTLVPTLPEIGFTGVSTFGPRKRADAVRGLRQVNTHVDLIAWKEARGFVGEEAALGQLVAALALARAGIPAGNAEPVGILSHHLAMDEPAWDFLQSFLGRAKTLPGVKLVPAVDLFASREARG